VNDAMPLYCVSRVQELLNDQGKPVRGSKVPVLGVTYKRDVADLRETTATALMVRLVQKGAELSYHDAHAPSFPVPGAGELKSVELTDDALAEADCVVVVTDHSDVDYAHVVQTAQLVFDTRNVTPRGMAHVHRLSRRPRARTRDGRRTARRRLSAPTRPPAAR
jgi:UDP-N-acetyl-D-glucosamine dehydrogenase